VHLDWDITEGDRVSIGCEGDMDQQVSGTVQVAPAADTTYTIAGAQSVSASLAPFGINTTAAGVEIKLPAGSSSTFSWTAAGNQAVTVKNDAFDQQPMSGTVVGSPTQDTKYTVTSYNWAGKTNSSAAVAVNQ